MFGNGGRVDDILGNFFLFFGEYLIVFEDVNICFGENVMVWFEYWFKSYFFGGVENVSILKVDFMILKLYYVFR